MRKDLYFVTAALLLLLTILYVRGFSHGASVPLPGDLKEFPMSLGEWTCIDSTSEEEIYTDDGADHGLSRICRGEAGHAFRFYIGYFGKQEMGHHVRSPKRHYPDRRWNYVQSEYFQVIPVRPENPPFWASSVIIQKGGKQELLTYWYQIQRGAFASDYRFRLQTIVNALLKGQTDAFIIRISSPLTFETLVTIRKAQQRFAGLLFAELNHFIS